MQAENRSRGSFARSRRVATVFGACCATFVACTFSSKAIAQQEWLVGKQRIRENRNPVSVTWSQSPLGGQLGSLSRQRRIAIWLDPDVDSSAKQTIKFRNRTTDQVLWETAQVNQLGATWVGDVLYIGPRQKTDRLPHVIDAVSRKFGKVKSGFPNREYWRGAAPTTWPTAATTTEIVATFRQQGLDFEDPDKLIPFDVLAAADWPKLKGGQRVCLFLAGYGLTLEVGRKGKPKVVSMPEIETGKTIVFIPEDVPIPARFEGLWKKSRRGKVTLNGPVDQIADFVAWNVELQEPSISEDQIETYSLNVTESRGSILKALAEQTDREFVFAQECVAMLNERVTVEAKDASFEDLVAQCMQGSELKIEISESELKVSK